MPLTTADAPGNTADRPCEICGRTESIAGVASVPGFPVSVLWCHPCLQAFCVPMFTLEATLCQLDPENEENNRNLSESIAIAKAHGLPREMELAEWYLESCVWVGGDYMKIRDYVGELWDAA